MKHKCIATEFKANCWSIPWYLKRGRLKQTFHSHDGFIGTTIKQIRQYAQGIKFVKVHVRPQALLLRMQDEPEASLSSVVEAAAP